MVTTDTFRLNRGQWTWSHTALLRSAEKGVENKWPECVVGCRQAFTLVSIPYESRRFASRLKKADLLRSIASGQERHGARLCSRIPLHSGAVNQNNLCGVHYKRRLSVSDTHQQQLLEVPLLLPVTANKLKCPHYQKGPLITIGAMTNGTAVSDHCRCSASLSRRRCHGKICYANNAVLC